MLYLALFLYFLLNKRTNQAINVSNHQKHKCFIIHLKRAKKRKAYVDEIIKNLDMKSEVINAIDGKLLTEEKILRYYSSIPLFDPKYPFKLNKGEIGCFLSFRKVWKKIVDQELSAGLIFEDDASLDPIIFQKSLDSALKWITEFGYIQFQVREISKKSKVLATNKSIKLLEPSPTLLRCSAQLISYSTAKKLLQITKKFDRPVDTFLQTCWNTNIKVTSIEPSGVIDNTNASGGSNLSLQVPLSKKLKQEYNRVKYRYYIKKYSEKYSN